MKNFILSVLNDVGTVLLIILFGMFAINASSILLSIVLWFIVYVILDLHVYLNNKLDDDNSFNIFY